MILSLSGCKRSGKDTCYQILKHEWESRGFRVTQFAFADALREVCSIVFGYTQEHFQDDLYKESFPSPILGPAWTPRRALQFVGTDLFRSQVDPDVWVRVGVKRLRALTQTADVVVVTDARFENELRAIKEVDTNACFVFVARPSQMPRACTHESERFVQELETNFVQLREYTNAADAALKLKGTFFDYVLFNESLDALEQVLKVTFPKPDSPREVSE